MPHTDAMVSYRITLSSAEYRLVTLALAVKLKDQKDIQDALILNLQLCHQRAEHIKSQCQSADASAKTAANLVNSKPES